MRKIRVGRITRPDDDPSMPYKFRKNYSIAVGDGQILFFKSERKANAFLAKYNKQLNLILIDLNDIYVQSFHLYRISYFYFDNSNRDHGRSAAKIVYEIDTLMHKALMNLGSGTPHYTLSFINGIIGNIKSINELLIDIHKCRNGFYEIKLAQTINGRLQYVSDRLKSTLDFTQT